MIMRGGTVIGDIVSTALCGQAISCKGKGKIRKLSDLSGFCVRSALFARPSLDVCFRKNSFRFCGASCITIVEDRHYDYAKGL